MKNKIGIVVILFLIAVFSVFAFRWVKHRMEYAVTDAVFVESDSMANLSFYRVKGKIIKLLKNEGDYVKKGEIIAVLDDTDYITKLEQVNNQIESLKLKKKALKEKLSKINEAVKIQIKTSKLNLQQINVSIQAIKHKIKQIEKEIELAKKDEERFRSLLKKELIPERKYDLIKTKLDILIEKKKYAQKKLEELKVAQKKAREGIALAENERKSVKELRKEIESLSKKIKSLEKQKEDIENQIRYTKLVSPYNGYIAKKFVSVGEVVPAGRPVYSIVPENSLYILVLLEETKLNGIKIGSKANIYIDAYPDEKFKGEVFEINPATAAKFALVPRDITAGEFTKVAQRVPVKIRITEGNTSVLKVGLGGEVEIKKEK
ncbi:membrane fusion protein, multidrug efflux system [Persephonella hydrogeniphila]|uniref:Membrane fusion protein, multidrug efflux system n=1 Tax=Persephonella hydrogeniphila TaxID=198703 RepID=A0A285N0F7_9AQUI|nr:HlyD family secretion protein [Persephonella hydrogeniphila]SNZ02920.1 membrane fusion protein, multidrug efflux system [Persephonella hydrogeniphila]